MPQVDCNFFFESLRSCAKIFMVLYSKKSQKYIRHIIYKTRGINLYSYYLTKHLCQYIVSTIRTSKKENDFQSSWIPYEDPPNSTLCGMCGDEVGDCLCKQNNYFLQCTPSKHLTNVLCLQPLLQEGYSWINLGQGFLISFSHCWNFDFNFFLFLPSSIRKRICAINEEKNLKHLITQNFAERILRSNFTIHDQSKIYRQQDCTKPLKTILNNDDSLKIIIDNLQERHDPENTHEEVPSLGDIACARLLVYIFQHCLYVTEECSSIFPTSTVCLRLKRNLDFFYEISPFFFSNLLRIIFKNLPVSLYEKLLLNLEALYFPSMLLNTCENIQIREFENK